MASPTTDRRLGLVGNTAFKAPADCATTGPITLAGEQAIDGVMTDVSRVLVWSQSNPAQNGLYWSSTANWTRCEDADGNYDLTNGSLVAVAGGSSYAGYVFKLIATNPITIDSSALVFSPGLFSASVGASFYQAGAGAVGRSAQNKMREEVSLRDFGGAVDGVTDDSAALALANAQAATVGAALLIGGTTRILTPTTITVPVVDTIDQIFTVTSQVTIANGLPVRPEWWGIANQNCVALAIGALPATLTNDQIGGVVQLENSVYPPNGWAYGFGSATGKSISTDNITIRGRQMPRLAQDCKSLIGGSIIQGMLLAFANNFQMENVGVDCGYTVVANFYGGTSAAGVTEAVNITYPNDTVKGAPTLKAGVRLRNVIGLCASPTALVHGVVIEGFADVVTEGTLVGCMGVHGVAIKSAAVKMQTVEAYCNADDGIIIKSDAQTTNVASQIQIDTVYTNGMGPRGLAPYATSTAGYGILLQATAAAVDEVQIDKAICIGCATGVGTSFGGPYSISSITINELVTDQLGVGGTTLGVQVFAIATENIYRFRINSFEARNCTVGLQAVFPQTATDLANHASVGHLTVVNASDAVDIGSQSYVDIGVVVTDGLTDAVYHITGTPKLTVGALFKDSATPAVYSTANSGLAPSLSNGWTQVAGNDVFGVDLNGGRIFLRGLIKPGTSATCMTLPQWAWPSTAKRFLAQGYNGSSQASVPVSISTAGVVTVNEIAGGTANCTNWLSLSGIQWDQQA